VKRTLKLIFSLSLVILLDPCIYFPTIEGIVGIGLF